jgi:hypothetical protein
MGSNTTGDLVLQGDQCSSDCVALLDVHTAPPLAGLACISGGEASTSAYAGFTDNHNIPDQTGHQAEGEHAGLKYADQQCRATDQVDLLVLLLMLRVAVCWVLHTGMPGAT